MRISLGLLLQVVLTGLAVGAASGLVAVGFVFLFRATGAMQLAQGPFAGLGVLVALVVMGGTAVAASTPTTGERAVGVGVAILGVSAASAALGVLVTREAGSRRELRWLGVVIAVSLLASATLRAAIGARLYRLPELVPGGGSRVALPFGAGVDQRVLWQVGIGFAVASAADLWLARSRTGRALVAIADDARTARVVGLRVRPLVVLAFALAGALAAIAGLLAQSGGTVGAQTGLTLGVNAAAAALLARFGGRRRVFVTALVLGIVETAIVSLRFFGAGPLGASWRVILPVAVAVIAFAWFPPLIARDQVE